MHPTDFDGGHDNADPAWPISYEDLKPYYADAEAALGVAGDADNPYAPSREGPYPMPGFPPSYSDSLFAEACESLGITMHGVALCRLRHLSAGLSLRREVRRQRPHRGCRGRGCDGHRPGAGPAIGN
jgi:choline dehydrogenase-like flavoprotein